MGKNELVQDWLFQDLYGRLKQKIRISLICQVLVFVFLDLRRNETLNAEGTQTVFLRKKSPFKILTSF